MQDSFVQPVRPRVDSVDRLRGLVMVLMALDHARDFFSDTAFKFDPADLTQTTPALFVTRFVTHFCAPVFVFLVGVGAFLSTTRGKTKGQLSAFLLTRGLFLIVLDPSVIRFTWFWEMNWRFSFGQVIWVIGWSMVILAGLIHLPRWVIATFGLGLIATHNLLDGVSIPGDTIGGMFWRFLHQRDLIRPIPGFQFLIVYPFIPWAGVLAVGYAFGSSLQIEAPRRRRVLFGIGLLMTLTFVALRWSNVYGDPRPWSTQKDALFTLFSFVNCEKYPPSLLFLLMTLGPAIAALAMLERLDGTIGRWFTVFGRVPLFFYLIHAPMFHLLAGLAMLPRFGWSIMALDPTNPPDGLGFSLPVVYLAWIGGVTALYLPCRWFAGVKRRRSDRWLSYL